MQCSRIVFGAALACAVAMAQADPLIFSAAGANAAAIQSQVDAYRASLGTLNANVPGSFGFGRREINWDGVPDSFAATNALPGNFFNVNSPRGIVMATPGSGFQVSANSGVGTIDFGNINATYPGLFAPFSAQRLFTALGSTITDVRFFVPGTTTPGVTRGFGAVFTNVDLEDTTGIEFFDLADQLLGHYFVQNTPGDQTLSFLGVEFIEGPIVARVRITSGNQILASTNISANVVVMDDFIYGEPVAPRAIPEPSTLSLLMLAMAITIGSRRVKRR